MTETKITYRFRSQHRDAVQALLGYGIAAIRGPVPHNGAIDWMECDVTQPEAEVIITKLGGERVTPR
ncbi:hypothetical protein [Shinella sp.]|uniref:hypothetical protein n=1 Tax=Shinella sp. TaxID=1870904 RepID=UPI002896491B|nr:hypothetical protein [Shinella sp.]